jgi:hypothetical protein
LAYICQVNEQQHAMNINNIPDDLNPKFLFSTTASTLLVNALNGTINLQDLAAKELANRGLDGHGKWVGFDRAAEILAEYFENA